MKTKRILTIMGIVCLIAMILTACAPAPAPTPSPKPAPTPAKDAPVQGGILKVIQAREAAEHGFPPNAVGPTRDYIDPLFDRLIQINDKGEYEAALATSWQTAADGKSMTFKIREGVKFHDGTVFDAAAAKWNLDNLRPPNPAKLTGVSSIEAVDATTLRVNLEAPNNLILYQLASAYECYMYSPTAYQKNGKDWAKDNAVGTGPFKQVSYSRNTGIKMVKNPDYWMKGLPYLDGLEMLTIIEDTTGVLALKAGQANASFSIKPEAAIELKNSGFKVLSAPGSLWGLTFDTKNNKILANQKAREAIEYAIDKEAISSGSQGLFLSKYQLFDEKSSAYNKACPPRKYNPEKAKQLLAEAGYPNGFAFKAFIQSSTWRPGPEAAQADLAKVGIKMDINYLSGAAYNEMRDMGKLEAGGVGMLSCNLFANPLYVIDFYFRSDSGIYQFFTRPAGTDALIAKAKASLDSKEVTSLCQQVVKMLYDDVTFIPIYDTARLVAVDDKTQDIGYFIAGDCNNNRLGLKTWLKK